MIVPEGAEGADRKVSKREDEKVLVRQEESSESILTMKNVKRLSLKLRTGVAKHLCFRNRKIGCDLCAFRKEQNNAAWFIGKFCIVRP